MPTKIKVGQLWKDDKKSRPRRYFVIAAMDDEYVLCRALRSGFESLVRRDRLKPGGAGYTFLMEEADVTNFITSFVTHLQRKAAEPVP